MRGVEAALTEKTARNAEMSDIATNAVKILNVFDFMILSPL